MFRAFSTAAFASFFLLTVAVPGWAADAQKAPPAKAEKKGEMAKKPAAKGKMSTGNEQTRKAQEALKAKGNDPGPIDGKMGPKTRAAIKAFQEANGMKGTGQLDAQTAEKLGVGKGGAAMGKEAKPMEKKGAEPMSKPSATKAPMKEPSKEKK